ncbi:glycosyltransferase family 2 protein [Solitalea koreensis]|uniref:Glycosyltransferase involved in cell wall bisynthesis n=1 Tax=Solitalea koreensis TaxID=543615 RepID=A0A521CQ32_9SPHI|nr:glycosyltransferase family 2 protein [Solitalea koreensis]SMO61516.1 Glycosyltransferase involved in cell wall bisynthesis [Solitalea koreensis]
MDKKQIDVSVIIPYYNANHCIERALSSINEQSFLPKEVIIVDDCSDEACSLKFIEEKKSLYSFEIKLLYHKNNLGASAARNTGIREARCLYVAFLDADDCWIEEKLEIQLKRIGEYDLLYSHYSESKSQINQGKINQELIGHKEVSYFDILKKNLSPVTLLAKRESLIFFDERFRRCDDFKMSIEALANGLKVGFLDFDVSYGFKKAIGESGLTKSLVKMSISYLKACAYLIIEYPKLIFTMPLFILFEVFKFPIRCLKVYFIN